MSASEKQFRQAIALLGRSAGLFVATQATLPMSDHERGVVDEYLADVNTFMRDVTGRDAVPIMEMGRKLAAHLKAERDAQGKRG